MPLAPEFHIAVNLAPTQGVRGPALLGTCVVSDSPIPQVGSASAPGLLRLEQAANVKGAGQSCSAPDPQPLGRKVYIPACKTLLEMLSECAKSGRAPSSHEILTWMDAEHPEADWCYMDSWSDCQTFGIHDAFNIMESEVCHLASFGHLGRGGALRLRQYTRDKILIPLDLWATKTESIGSALGVAGQSRIFKWQNEVQQGYIEDIEDPIEDIEDPKDIEEVKVEEADDVCGGESLEIEEIFDWREANVGQWEEEI